MVKARIRKTSQVIGNMCMLGKVKLNLLACCQVQLNKATLVTETA